MRSKYSKKGELDRLDFLLQGLTFRIIMVMMKNMIVLANFKFFISFVRIFLC